MQFIKEYWAWIVVPFVLVIVGLLLLAWIVGGDQSGPFVYNVF